MGSSLSLLSFLWGLLLVVSLSFLCVLSLATVIVTVLRVVFELQRCLVIFLLIFMEEAQCFLIFVLGLFAALVFVVCFHQTFFPQEDWSEFQPQQKQQQEGTVNGNVADVEKQ